MGKVRIVTDSTNCLPSDLIEEFDIRVARYHLILDGRDYRDQIDITPADFWEEFGRLKEIPTTSSPSPGDYESIFDELSWLSDNILCITISSVFSAAHKAAEIAKNAFMAKHPNLNIQLLDARNAAGALGFVVLEAARAANSGMNLMQVTEVANQMVPKVKFLITLDTLKYLIKGGRAPKTAVVGELLQIKPIIGIIDNEKGAVESLGRERGRKKAMRKMVDMIGLYTNIKKPLHVIVHYTDSVDSRDELREMVTLQYDCTELYMTDLTPVMTTHTGPAVGLSFYS